jgi:translation initiation factor 3 subunit H
LEVNGKLEITNTFPYPNLESDAASEEYQFSMLAALRTVNVDHSSVGWYQSASFASFLTPELIVHQYSYQSTIPHSVVIVHDSLLTSKGKLALRAYRLNDDFMKLYEKAERGKVSQDMLNNAALDATAILEELPIKVHSSHLVHGFLYELREERSMSCEADRLSLASQSFLNKSLSFLGMSVEDFISEQSRLVAYQRALTRQKIQQQAYLQKRAQDNESRVAAGKEPLNDDLSKNPLFKPLTKPNRVDALMTTNQIHWYAQQLSSMSSQALSKLYLTQALHKE